jgi:hypothetical protein
MPDVFTAQMVQKVVQDNGIVKEEIVALSGGDAVTINDQTGAISIADGDIAIAKLADIATGSLIGRNTAGSGVPEILSAATARSLLNVSDGANNYSHPNHTGDVTSSGDGAQTIADEAVTLAKMAHVATQSILGRTTAATGDVEALTATQATAILDAMVGDSGSGGTKGLVPAPAAGDAAALKFLKADGTWAATAGGGTGNLADEHDDSNDTIENTGATTFQVSSLNSSFTVSETTTYNMHWSMALTHSETGKVCEGDVQININSGGWTTIGEHTANPGNEADIYFAGAGTHRQTLTAADSVEYRMRWRISPNTTGGTARIRRKALVIYKVVP